ncbi:BREX-1 system phosphatase PglZ type A [Aquitalea sp. USM4]|uniref:BREX-1 system phosphatase PglZ type A n=1 Tax=Aquitalea sp. USM4 TaxID=1590041 RepID=UPI001040BADE|nr:BREX-1 system phosphatase PglZ type A [Aquitalea sp. USM4]QBJ76914.1 BREX-1 system phosphatase PglZ type A [Aquitalea sp. USM4]
MTSKVSISLESQFRATRFVFWHDTESHYTDEVEQFQLPGVQLLRVDEMPALEIKRLVEQAPADSKWLFYSTQPEPMPEHDWLLDVRMRSRSFHADSLSILIADWGLSPALRPHLQQRSKYLAAKERVARLGKLVLPGDSAADLDRKMIAASVRADQPDFSSILLRLLTALEQDGKVDLQASSRGWDELVAMELAPAFWQLVEAETGYREEAPSLRSLIMHMLVSDLARGIRGELPLSLQHFMLPDPVKAATVSVFISQWRANIGHFDSYNAISAEVAEQLQLGQALSGLNTEALLDAMTFAEVEKLIIVDLRNRILSGAGAALDTVRNAFTRRRDGHWANPKLAANSTITRALVACYEALEAAADLFDLQALHKGGFSFADASTAANAYQQQLFRFDQDYRHFHFAASQVDTMGWQLLHTLRDRVEGLYSDWFIPQLSTAWGKVLEGDSGLLQRWQIPGKVNQEQFFQREVQSLLEGSIKRVFVVISDAFRYEAAEELCRNITSRNRFKASLDSMLGVLPSYTSLGMAALLPHTALSYKHNEQLDVLVDGKPTSTLEQRSAILAARDGLAIKWESLIELGKEKGRELVRDYRVVYVYHDRIDMLGDKAASESKTFEAVRDTVQELDELIASLINNLNASTVLVTADHGFLYQQSSVDAADKSTLEVKPDGIVKSKKRYLLGHNLGKTDKAWCGNTQVTANTTTEGSVDFWVPKGAIRFHFAGGAQFVHGSAMPQEVLVPLLTVKVSDSEKAKTSQVGFAPLMLTQKVVTNIQKFEFIQTEPVTDKVLARTVRISLRDGNTLISNEQTVTFDSASTSMEDRKKTVILTVQAGSYDKLKDYYLVGMDQDGKSEVIRIALKIDLALANEF